MASDLKDLVTLIAQSLVERPEEVQVTEVEGDRKSVV